MIYEYTLATHVKQAFYDITAQVKEAVKLSKVDNGIAYIYSPHTTSGVTLNENSDPDVAHDILMGLNSAFSDNTNFKHLEGNSQAHLLSSVIGISQTVFIAQNALQLGRWQAIYFCEFDGPRQRRFLVKIVSD